MPNNVQPAAVAVPVKSSPSKPISPHHHINLLPPQLPQDCGKKTLVLDLDETLIHSVFKKVDGADIMLKIPEEVVDINGNTYQVMNDIYVFKRPGVDMFLKRLSRYYELVIFTASIDKYANPVIDSLDIQNLTRHRLYREHCTFMYNVFIKDLKRLGRNMEDILILDNSPISYLFQKQNALPIKTWLDDKNDIELYKYLRLLEYIAKVKDVRDIITQIVDQQNNEIDFDIFDNLMTTEHDSPAKPTRKQIVSESRKILSQHNFGASQNIVNSHSSSSMTRKSSKNKSKLKMYEVQNDVDYQIPIVDRLMSKNKSQIKSNKMLTSNTNMRQTSKPQNVQDIQIDTLDEDLLNSELDNGHIFSAQYSAVTQKHKKTDHSPFETAAGVEELAAENFIQKYKLLTGQHRQHKHYYAGADSKKVHKNSIGSNNSQKLFPKSQRKSASLLKPATPISDVTYNKLHAQNIGQSHNWSHKASVNEDTTDKETNSISTYLHSNITDNAIFVDLSNEKEHDGKQKESRNLSAKPDQRLGKLSNYSNLSQNIILVTFIL